MRTPQTPAAAPQDQRTSRQRSGDAGEAQALAYLQGAGLRLLQQNFLCKGGEIDLIMQDGAALVFVEVRQRSGGGFGGALASVTPAKQRRLVHAAQFYLLRLKPLPPCRFDLVAIDAGKLSWLRNVLEAHA